VCNRIPYYILILPSAGVRALTVARQNNQTIHCTPRHFKPPQHHKVNANIALVENCYEFAYLIAIEIHPVLESRASPARLPQVEIYPWAGAPLSDYIAEPLECCTQGCLWTNLLNDPYHLFEMPEQYKCILCGIKNKCIKSYYDFVQKDENVALRSP
jgi:hypothetical protein